jgi:hypothetical protein
VRIFKALYNAERVRRGVWFQVKHFERPGLELSKGTPI